uniref:Putative D-ribose periplasmic binding protein n=1 Tax=Magnetococcus massalia (strain MO-1) TaxID=451514 RepID=A0A1S7LL59_MAGMO|nr:putative D-ribose periplasmic binding protein [Candidatus Magnetococcus massalia]
MIRALLLLSLLLLSTPLWAQERRIGVLYWSMNIPCQVAMRQGLEGEAKRLQKLATTPQSLPFTLLARVAGDGEAGIQKQIKQMHALVEERVDLIIVQPTDNAALAEPLRAANAANIPVVAYDQYISGGRLAAFVTSDNYQAGYQDGEYMAHAFADDYTIRLILVEYPHVSSTVDRVNGFLDAMSSHKQPFKIIKSYEAVEPVGGRQAGLAILRDFPESGSIDAIFAVNDGGAIAMTEVLASSGRDEIFIATIDGDPQAIQKIAQGKLIRIDSAQFCGPLGAEAMRAGHQILSGKPTAQHWLVPTFPITRETLTHYPGWLGPLPTPFTKPWESKTPQWQGQLRVITP